MKKLDVLAAVLLIVGGLNWGLVGLFEFDLVATLFGGIPLIMKAVYVRWNCGLVPSCWSAADSAAMECFITCGSGWLIGHRATTRRLSSPFVGNRKDSYLTRLAMMSRCFLLLSAYPLRSMACL